MKKDFNKLQYIKNNKYTVATYSFSSKGVCSNSSMRGVF